MAGSFSEQLEELLNPKPRLTDPEDDEEEATRAKVIERLTQEEEEEEDGGLSLLRKNNTSLLSDTDPRYRGRKVTRRELLQEVEVEEEEEEENSVEEIEEDGEDSVRDDDDNDDDDDDDEEEEAAAAFKTTGAEVTFPQRVDYHKLTEGMDDLVVSKEEVTEGSDEDDDDDDDDEMEDDSEEGDDGEDGEETVRTFSQEKVDEEVERGRAVKDQLALWDQLLEGRIKLQKVLVMANQLPQPPTFNEFRRRGGAELGAELKNSHKALKALQRSLLELHDLLLDQNPDTRTIAQDNDEEVDSDEDEEAPEVGASKRKLEMAEYPDFMAKRFVAFQPYCNATLQKWHDKTRLALGRSSRGFGAFDRNILTQVEQVLMDQERLVRRTQTRRSEYRVLGKKEVSVPVESIHLEGQDADQQLKANTHLKDLDEDIFDDDDFYHQLLRELIERKTSAADPNDQVAMGRQWLAIQKLRSKIKKKVDTKASKGRKVRFHVHSKLVNFMAPMDHSSLSDEARSELYRGLFGQNAAVRD